MIIMCKYMKKTAIKTFQPIFSNLAIDSTGDNFFCLVEQELSFDDYVFFSD